MTRLSTPRSALGLALVGALLLGACGGPEDGTGADDFASRIKSGTPAATPSVAPSVAQTLPGAAPGPFTRGTLTDPAAKTCGATLMGPFIGKLADQPTRAAIVETLGRKANLRFVAYGSIGNVNPDPTNPRLSIMLDAQNIIRDARCG